MKEKKGFLHRFIDDISMIKHQCPYCNLYFYSDESLEEHIEEEHIEEEYDEEI